MPLSLADRIALQKMLVLPRFLYLFWNIPIWLTQATFARIRSALQRLTWAGKLARISWKTLTQPYYQGGFEAPDFQLYFICAQAQHTHYWGQPHAYIPHIAVEHDSVHPLPLTTFTSDPKRITPRRQKQTVYCTSRAWHTLTYRANKLPVYARALPLAHHSKLTVTQEKKMLLLLKEMRCNTMDSVFPHNQFISFEDPTLCAHQSPLKRFAYLRLRMAIKELYT